MFARLLIILCLCFNFNLDSASLETNTYLLKILELTNIKHDGSLKGIVDKTQSEWLRKKGEERWHLNSGKHTGKKELILQYLIALGCVDTAHPRKKTYTYVVVNGSGAKSFRKRLKTLIDAWESGVRFKKVIFIGGARPLDPKTEADNVIFDESTPHIKFKKNWSKPKVPLKTEMDMMRYLYEQSDVPSGLRALPTIYINSPMKRNGSGKWVRPTTSDTVIKWLKDEQPEKGASVLSISNQPYVHYQESVFRTYTDKHDLEVEMVGLRADENTKIAVYLDTLARNLYQENKRTSG